ncbi:flagellar biosynthesis protein FlgA [Micromonospora sp. KC723]|nr:flagellar biosynthesis protein FlgA [Micromonospora sp. KC723]
MPTGGALLRAGLVAVLLGLAALVLDGAGGCPTPGPVPSTAAAPPSGHRVTGTLDARRGGDDIAARAGPLSSAPGPGADGRPSPLPLPSGAVGVPVRLAEPAALAVLRPGARVDLLVVPAGRAAAEALPLASGALVLDVVGDDIGDGSSALYLALGPDQARRTVGQPEGSRFAVVVRG